mmetsp:Transcript_7207/g.23077  ORF Transcript_7207/g.23077 Transcript_7207/m.23077 type:complete len:228 (-) Transcript_7207:223-906(-)
MARRGGRAPARRLVRCGQQRGGCCCSGPPSARGGRASASRGFCCRRRGAASVRGSRAFRRLVIVAAIRPQTCPARQPRPVQRRVPALQRHAHHPAHSGNHRRLDPLARPLLPRRPPCRTPRRPDSQPRASEAHPRPNLLGRPRRLVCAARRRGTLDRPATPGVAVRAHPRGARLRARALRRAGTACVAGDARDQCREREQRPSKPVGARACGAGPRRGDRVSCRRLT